MHLRITVKPGWVDKIWWMLVPGTEIKVRWPRGWTEPDEMGVQTESGDPNDHYRPWMEKHVGRQTWDWNWMLKDDDVSRNLLTIKIRRGRDRWATIAAMKWN